MGEIIMLNKREYGGNYDVKQKRIWKKLSC